MSASNVNNPLSPCSYLYFTPSTNPELAIQKLPTEIIYNIFSYFSVADWRGGTATVCKEWNIISTEYLILVEKEECRIIRKCATLLSEALYVMINQAKNEMVEDEEDEEDDQESYEQEISLAEVLSVIGKETDENIEIKSSLKLRNQVVDQLTALDDDDFFEDLFDTIKDKDADKIAQLARCIRKSRSYRDIADDVILGFDDHQMTAAQFKIASSFKSCYLAIHDYNAFDRALKVAAEISSNNPSFMEFAKGMQVEAYVQIAKALTQFGYFGQALEIADKDIYSGDRTQNLKYKVVVLRSICEGFSEINFFGRIPEMIDQIHGIDSQVKIFYQQFLSKQLSKIGKFQEAIKVILEIPDQVIQVEELKEMAIDLFQQGKLELAETIARTIKDHGLLREISLHWAKQENVEEAANILCILPAEFIQKEFSIQVLNQIGRGCFVKGKLELAERVARLSRDYHLLARIAIDWNDQGNQLAGMKIVIETSDEQEKAKLIEEMIKIKGQQAIQKETQSRPAKRQRLNKN